MSSIDKTIEVRGKVIIGEKSLDGVRVRITLPVSLDDQPKMLVLPESREQFQTLSHTFKYAFESKGPSSPHVKDERIVVCEEVYTISGRAGDLSHDIQHHEIECEPVGVWYSRASRKARRARKSHIAFRITPNGHLSDVAILIQSYDGSCKVKRARQLSFELMESAFLKFERRYSWSATKSSHTTLRHVYQVATLDLAGDYHEPSTIKAAILPKLEDLLLLTSFASSRRCICLRWDVSDSSGRSSYYDLGRVGRPLRDEPPVFNTGLIPLHEFKEFLEVAWPIFQNSPYVQALRSAIHALLPMTERTEEGQFTAMFSALEELALVFKRQSKNERLLGSAQWKRLSKNFEAVLDDGSLAEDVRQQIKEKLGELNRAPVKRVLTDFIAHNGAETADLWPLFSDRRDGLINIRNRIIHGDMDTGASIGSLSVATRHLRWTLERIVLAILNWPVEKSEIAPHLLKQHATAMIQLEEARSAIMRVRGIEHS